MILNIRVDHKTANIGTMERSAQKLDVAFQEILEKYAVVEYIQIKTCNRTEFYMVLEGSPKVEYNDFVVETDKKALEHLLRLASGLESMIVGEDQILGQIKDSRKRSIKEKCCGRVLNTVFTKAVHVGQSVRKKTRINEGSVSIGSAAVDLAEKVHGNLKCKKVLVVGAGKMGTLVAKALVEKNLKAIVVANRTHDRAVCLARELGGSAIHFDKLGEAMKDADVVISATGAPHPILTYEKVKESVPAENLHHMVMVDIANPRDIDERVSELGVKLFNIDDLRGVADESLKMREAEAVRAERIVEEELELLQRSLKHMEVEPLISSIRADAEKIRVKETEKALKILGDMEGKERVVEDLTKVLVKHISYDIIQNLKHAAEKEQKDVIEAAEVIFKGEF
ncbi:glutamyl-tRNA reductase [Methanobacterium congolense]|uniref:Glutamyl-tRNA reductase n=1 Tax=Methanobacterium congolense TaxID=118062 RepID=A0A1D3KZK9_9EURY|nr:glutamyl-tRNA reductase [Methanobacterium congolense]SCG84797.1 Glutamyl-tRNA reductase [Methanobacterium congolense]